MMKKPKISVIVPMFNAALYIKTCIESVLNQDYVDFELLLIDDGSLDDTVAICKYYANCDTRVKLICHGENRGVSFARNTGLQQASGDWIAFVDADDKVSHDWLSDQNSERTVRRLRLAPARSQLKYRVGAWGY